MDRSSGSKGARRVGIALIAFAIGFNLPYVWLASTFDYPAILRSPPGVVLSAFADGGAPLVIAWAAFALAALLFAPIAVGVAMVTRRRGYPSSEVAALGHRRRRHPGDRPVALGLFGARPRGELGGERR